MSSKNTMARASAICLLIGAMPVGSAWAQLEPSCPAGTQCSTNTIHRNVPLPNFKEDDIGLIVDLVYELCSSDVTSLADGPYRRISNAPGPANPGSPTGFSEGDATLDMVVWDSKFAKGGGNWSTVKVSASEIAAQVGINPGADLTANVSLTSTTLTIVDTTGAGAPSPFVPGQLIDAGPNIGGIDAVMTLKNGTVKTADVVCDQNMYFRDGSAIKYGLTGFDISAQPVNRLLLFWNVGPSGMGSPAAITAACAAYNPVVGGAIAFSPAVQPSPAPSPDIYDASNYANAHLRRQIESVAIVGRGVRPFGEPPLPSETTTCNGVIAYCDSTEPTPVNEGDSGNSCNRNRGFASAPNPFDDSLNDQNPSYTSTSGGSTTFSNFSTCPYPGYPTC